MDKIEIEGGARLKGDVRISGAKNAALPVMAASILGPGENISLNIPLLTDITTIGKLLAHLGMGYHQEDDEAILLSENSTSIEAPYDFVKTMRSFDIFLIYPLK